METIERFDQTEASSLLSRNHDLHMHSKEFSDGLHSLADVVQFAARWQAKPKWVGISDHSHDSNEQLERYFFETRRVNQKILSTTGIKVLTGLEVEWSGEGPAKPDLDLRPLDYVIAGYHGKKLNSPDEALRYFRLVAGYPYTDIVAHPDWFLGKVDRLAINWEVIFNTFSDSGVLCEYNLTTPLHPEILYLAIHNTEVSFTIGSDTHDFRYIGVKRIIDAWSETMAGGFELARDYLLAVLKLQTSTSAVLRYAQHFNTAEKLITLQDRVYALTLNSATKKVHLTEEESELIAALNQIPECKLDIEFNESRFIRFESLPADRIVSAYGIDEFERTIQQGRIKRSKFAIL